ncbi:MAG: hypothetical protein JWQ27_3317 [Ferruginibacter sp.]|nr:hypothetical protein [Ferruginibacter sp.]
MPNQAKNLTDQDAQITEIFTDDDTHRKIQEHLSNPNDTITEEDIKNIKTDMTLVSQETADARYTTNPEVSADPSKVDGNNSNEIDSTWNILDE